MQSKSPAATVTMADVFTSAGLNFSNHDLRNFNNLNYMEIKKRTT